MAVESERLRERERGLRAQAIIENEICSEVWEKMAENARTFMEMPETTDEDVLEARRMLIVLKRVKVQMETIFTTGNMAQMQIAADTERSHGRASTEH